MKLTGCQVQSEWVNARNAKDAACQSIIFHALVIFIQDCKMLVENHVRSSIARGLNSEDGDEKGLVLRCQKALKEWLKTFLALGWSSGKQAKAQTYRYLITVLHEDASEQPGQLRKSTDCWSYEIMAKHLWRLGTNESGSVEALVLSNESFVTALPMAIQYICGLRGVSVETDIYLIVEIELMMCKMHINFVPWKKNTRGARVARAMKWMMLQSGGGSRLNGPQVP
jgi:type II secretory pathway component PulJ